MGNSAGTPGPQGPPGIVNYETVKSSLISDQMFKGQIIDAMKLNGNFIGPTGYTRFTELDQDSKTNLINDLVTRYKTTFGQEIINSEALKQWLRNSDNSPTFRGPAGLGYDSDASKTFLKATTLWCADGSCITPKNIDLSKGQFIEFGKGVDGKDQNAGKVGYQVFSDGLDIIGAGTLSNRKVRLQDNLEVSGSLKIGDWVIQDNNGGLRFYKAGDQKFVVHDTGEVWSKNEDWFRNMIKKNTSYNIQHMGSNNYLRKENADTSPAMVWSGSSAWTNQPAQQWRFV